MGNKKKRDHPDIEEVLGRPWCYYCERDFDDLKILINHQKAKHFKCERCGRRLNTAGGTRLPVSLKCTAKSTPGLSVHMTQVHKETLASIDNALPNRSNLEVEIFGMEGIPEDVVNSHNQRVLTQFAQVEADRRAATGNSGPGGGSAGGVKKPKFESPSDLKKRLAEHKAKKAAEQAAGIDSGDVTPVGAGQGSQSPSTFVSLVVPRALISKAKCFPLGWLSLLPPAANAIRWTPRWRHILFLSTILCPSRVTLSTTTCPVYPAVPRLCTSRSASVSPKPSFCSTSTVFST